MPGRIPQQFIDDLLSRIDIVDVIEAYVPLKKAGRDFKALCPFHAEKTASFTVSQAKQFYHCFGCGANGTAITFLMEHGGLSFIEAVEELASRAGMSIPREVETAALSSAGGEDHTALYELMELAVRFYARQLREHPERQRAVEYLKGRGLSGEIAGEFELGYAPPAWDTLLQALGRSEAAIKRLAAIGLVVQKDGGGYYDRFRDRILFPIRDRRGRAVGFGGRVIDQGEPKYLNSPETPIFHKGSEIYGLYQARKAARDIAEFYVVEGYMDVLALAQAGIRNAVATLGTAVTREHVERLFRAAPRTVFCFDGDEAGRKAALRAMEIALPLLRDGRQAAFMFMPEGEDPDSFVRRHGRKAFEDPKLAVPLSDYLLEHLKAEAQPANREGRARFIEQAIPFLNQLPEGALKHLLLKDIATIARLEITELSRLLSAKQSSRKPAGPSKVAPGMQAPSLVGHLIRILLQRPALALEVAEPRGLAGADLPGAEFLAELLEFIQARPGVKCGGILEHWRDSKYYVRLQELAAAGLMLGEEANLEAEFRDGVARLLDRRRLQRIRELHRRTDLTESERQELKALTAGVQPDAGRI